MWLIAVPAPINTYLLLKLLLIHQILSYGGRLRALIVSDALLLLILRFFQCFPSYTNLFPQQLVLPSHCMPYFWYIWYISCHLYSFKPFFCCFFIACLVVSFLALLKQSRCMNFKILFQESLRFLSCELYGFNNNFICKTLTFDLYTLSMLFFLGMNR